MRILTVRVDPNGPGLVRVTVMGKLNDGRFFTASSTPVSVASVGDVTLHVAGYAEQALQGGNLGTPLQGIVPPSNAG